MLLEKEDVEPNLVDGYGRTPLSWAAWRGHQEIVKMLLERDEVRTAAPYNERQSPLSLAVDGGHVGVVRILLGQSNVNSSVVSSGSRRPRHPQGMRVQARGCGFLIE